VRYENLKWRFWPGAEETYGSANESLHAAPVPCCAQRKDCKTSVNSENLHVSLVTAVFRELQLDSFNISSQILLPPILGVISGRTGQNSKNFIGRV